jgi:hypothetical protein
MGQRTARWISERLDIDTNLHWVVRKRGEGG